MTNRLQPNFCSWSNIDYSKNCVVATNLVNKLLSLHNRRREKRANFVSFCSSYLLSFWAGRFSGGADECYKRYLLGEMESKRKQDEERLNPDPTYVRFLENLKKDDKSYRLEYEKNGVIVTIKYEGDSSSDTEVEKSSESDTTLSSSGMKQMKEEDDIIELHDDIHYHHFHKNLKLVNKHHVYMDADRKVVCEQKKKKKNDDDDDDDDDIETLDSATFYKMMMLKQGGESSDYEFRDKVRSALRKPFDEAEYAKLREDIEVRKPVDRHLDLRNGRERRSSHQQKYGKSYLDHHPAFTKKLLQVEHDKHKALNLLRGFFLWLEHPDAFSPWLDNECLAIYPTSA